MRSENINELAAALSKAQGEMSLASKDAVGQFKNKYATLSSVIEAIRKPFADNGLSFTQMLQQGQDGMILETFLLHASGQWIQSEFLVEVDDRKGISSVQAMGLTLTYYKRYALTSIAGVSAADDDNDGQDIRPKSVKVQKPQSNGKEAQSDNLPSPQNLLDKINRQVQIPYDNVNHLLGAIRKERDEPAWIWPIVPKQGWDEAWNEAEQDGINYANRKLEQEKPLFPDDEDKIPF